MRHLRIALAGLFLFMQSYAVSHAAAHNNSPHEHNGVTCEIGLIAPDVDLLEPPVPVVTLRQSFFVDNVAGPLVQPTFISSQSRTPLGRGPPIPS